MKVLELFSGSGVVSQAFESRGYKTFKVDNNPDLKPDLVADILELTAEDIIKRFGRPKIIWASPPCQCFSVCVISKNFTPSGFPKRVETFKAIGIVKKTLDLIKELQPDYFFIENPRGMLRKQNFMKKYNRKTVTYCQYGDNRQKPTDIWNNLYSWIPRPKCNVGDFCHDPSPRGSGGGTQGLANAYERGKIPAALINEIIDTIENKAKIIQTVLI